MATPGAARTAVRRLALRTLLGLPSPLLRLLSGGGVVYKAGRTLDPRLQFLAAQSRNMPSPTAMSLDEARRASAQGLSALSAKSDPAVTSESIAAPAPDRTIPARAYRPARQDPTAPLLVYAHMGGGVIGDLETADAFCAMLAATARCPVLSVDYRLAPEHRFPSGLEDVLAAYRWGRDNAALFGAPAGKAAIGGDSMGGTFAAVICQILRRAGEPQPAVQLLIYPCVDISGETPSMVLHADAFVLNRPLMDWFMGQYIDPGADPADTRLSPLREPDLAGLAPAIVVVAGFDPLIDQGESYALALRDAGGRVTYRAYDSLTHGFTAFTGAIPAAADACREIAALVRDALNEPLA